MTLGELLDALPAAERRGDPDPSLAVDGVVFDSRRAAPGTLFVCVVGLTTDGHDHAAAAREAGAVALVVERWLEVDAPQVRVGDSREALARLAGAFYGHPSRRLTVIGVTGTNGKTSVTHLLRTVGAAAGRAADVFGTLGSSVGGRLQPTGFTTPDAVTTQRLLREAADGGSDWVAMEVSSHALDQKRTFGTVFAAAVFTNLSRDHLDYHGTEEAYLEAKAKLFLPEERGTAAPTVAVIHRDDPAGNALWGRVPEPRASYGRAAGNDYRAVDVVEGPRGSRYRLVTPQGEAPVVLPLLGEFNVTNALAAQATAVELGVEPHVAARALADATPVRGRMELVDRGQPFLVVVDFAHTPDALERALTSLRPLAAGSLRVVFGCGGERDAGKRPVMGAVAARIADRVIVTSDNPRSEDPEAILDAVWAGIPAGADAAREPDRARAIRLALEEAQPGDAVLIAGKGHETEQIVGTRKFPFDDRAVAAAILEEHGTHHG